MIAATNYIHYYENHQNILKNIKQNMNVDWYSNQHRKNRRLLNQRERDLNKDLSLNFNQIQNDLSNIFNNQNLQAVDVDMHGLEIKGPRGGTYDASSAAKDLAKVLSNSRQELNIYLNYLERVLGTIDMIHDKLGLNQISALVLDHSNNPDAEIAGYLANKNGEEILINQESIAVLESSYESLREGINGLKSFNVEEVSSSAKTLEMQNFLKSIRGGINGIKGILLEGELFAGLCNGLFTGLDLIDVQMTGLGKEKKDPRMKSDKQILQEAFNSLPSASVAKNNPNSDLTLTFNKDGGEAHVGISVKNHHTDFNSLPSVKNKYDFAQTLGLGSKANLYEEILKASHQLSKLTGVDPIFYGQQAFGVHKYGSAGSQAGTASYWEDYLDAVAALNVLDRLAGEGGFGNFSRFLVVNGYVFSMDDILLSIAKHPDQVYGFSLLQYTGRGINSWRNKKSKETDMDAAIRRSEEAKAEMIDRWKGATLSTKINLAILANIQ